MIVTGASVAATTAWYMVANMGWWRASGAETRAKELVNLADEHPVRAVSEQIKWAAWMTRRANSAHPDESPLEAELRELMQRRLKLVVAAICIGPVIGVALGLLLEEGRTLIDGTGATGWPHLIGATLMLAYFLAELFPAWLRYGRGEDVRFRRVVVAAAPTVSIVGLLMLRTLV